MRVLPLENEDVNECWLADRDRFSYEALNGAERLTAPMIKQGGEWKTVDWTDALDYVARGLTQIAVEHGAAEHRRAGDRRSPRSRNCTCSPSSCAASAARTSTSRAMRETRGADGGGDALARHARSPSLSTLQRALVVGSFLRKDHPLFAQRLRQAAKKGAKVDERPCRCTTTG